MSQLQISINCWSRISGIRVELYLIPAEENDGAAAQVFAFSCVGSGSPLHAWNHRWLHLCSVPPDAVPGELEQIVQAHETEILKLAEAYRGSEWDGNNHVGRWELDDEYATWALSEAVSECPTYWDVDEWFDGGDPTAVHTRALELGVEAATDAEVKDALSSGVYLARADVAKAIERLIGGAA